MSFQQGLSGLSASSRALDVIGNNIANSGTIGFKGAESHFADMYAASMTGGSALQVGIGTKLAAVAQQFTQGNITTTNNPLDIAISGNGFFRMSDRGAVSYTRNGQFHLDKNGFFINDGGLRLTGYPVAQDGTIRVQTPTDLQITPDLLKLAPVATGASIGGEYSGVRMSVNVDSRVEAKTWTAPTGGIPNIDPNMYNHSTALTIYDSLGNPHTMSFYFVKTATTGEWEIYGNVDGTLSDGAGDVPSLSTPITVTFDSNGALASVNGTAVAANGATPDVAMSIDLAQVATNLGRVDWGATSPLTFNFSLAGTTQYGAAYSEDRKTQDGYNSGVLAGLSVSGEGIIQGRYSNGQSRNIGQLVLANFQNPNGLQNIGGNQWIETSASGQPVTGAPGSGLLGSVQSNAVEESNVDLTNELVRMITQQRNYQANAQTIKTQDQVMQTLVNLR